MNTFFCLKKINQFSKRIEPALSLPKGAYQLSIALSFNECPPHFILPRKNRCSSRHYEFTIKRSKTFDRSSVAEINLRIYLPPFRRSVLPARPPLIR